MLEIEYDAGGVSRILELRLICSLKIFWPLARKLSNQPGNWPVRIEDNQRKTTTKQKPSQGTGKLNEVI